MSEELTPRQQILLWDLVSRGGTALQKDIKPEPVAEDRKRLEQARLIRVSKDGNAFRLTFNEDTGWANLVDNPPTLLKSGGGSKYDRAILQFVFERIGEFARANSLSLSQIIAAKRILADESGEDFHAYDSAGNSPQAKKDSAPRDPIEGEIVNAFFAIAGRPAVNQVRLRVLRERLAHVPRQVLDKTLVAMRESRRASFSRLSNPPDISAEGDAALTIGDQQFHTIWIEP